MRFRTRGEEAGLRLRAALGQHSATAAPVSILFGVDQAAAPGDVPEPGVPLPDPPTGRRAAVFDPKRRGMAALAGVALAAAVAAGLVTLRARPRAAVVPRVERSAVAVATPSRSAIATVLVVDVVGAVHRPGLQRLPAGARVADAVAAAGGARAGTPTEGLNLARKVVDGEQIVVGATTGAPGAATGGSVQAPPPGAQQPVNLNAAGLAELDALTGVGPVLAQRILDWRTEHGGFASVEQLREIEGIGERKFESLAEQVTV